MSTKQSTEQDAVVRCSGTRRTGEPCRSPIVLDDGYCLTHSPHRAAERAAQRRAGGRARSNVRRAAKALPPTLAGVHDHLMDALSEVHRGELLPAPAQAMAALARAIAVIVQYGEFEDRLKALEAQLATGGWR